MSMLKLNPDALNMFSMEFSKFRRVLEDVNMDYSFFRGEIYCDESNENVVSLDLLGSDENGNFKRIGLTYDMSTDAVYYSKKFKVTNEAKLIKAMMRVLEVIVKINKPISKVYFDITRSKFALGKLVPDHNTNGEFIMYLMGELGTVDIYNLSDAASVVGKDIAEDWRKVGVK